jgi:CheY-like chemotaxis protein
VTMSDRKLRVLLAEDEPICSRCALAALHDLGHDVVTVETGRAALDLLKRERFDVALLDLGLPELSGLDVACRLRTHERASEGGAPVVIIALTASDLDEAARDAAGIDAVLEKPIRAAELGDVLARTCRPRGNGPPALESLSTLDLAALSARANHEDDFVRELLADFLGMEKKVRGEIVGAVEAGDHTVASTKAHKLRGALLAVGANRAARGAGEVETLAATLAKAAPTDPTEPRRAALSEALRGCLASVDEALAEVRRFLDSPPELCRAAS